MIYNLEYLNNLLLKQTKIPEISDTLRSMLSSGYNVKALADFICTFCDKVQVPKEYEDDLDDLISAMEGWCDSSYQLHPNNFITKDRITKSYQNNLEPCNRCCSGDVENINGTVTCANCNHSEDYSEWQLRGWRDLTKNSPTFGGTIHVYGKEIGRTMAKWDADTKTCDNPKATHWLRVPDPTKQINM